MRYKKKFIYNFRGLIYYVGKFWNITQKFKSTFNFHLKIDAEL